MFSTITWQQYFFFIGFVTLAYYGFVAVKYFKWELLALAGIHKEGARFSDVVIPKFTAPNESGDVESEIDFSPVLQDFRDEVGAYIAEASTAKLSQGEVVRGLQSIITKYPVLNTPAQTVIRNEIVSQELQNSDFAKISHHNWQAADA